MGAAEAPEPSSAQGYVVASSKSAALRVVGHAPSAPAARPPLQDREAWVALFRTVRDETERRAAPLSPEDQVVQSMPDASPTKWHRAHTTWFFEEFLLAPTAHYSAYDPTFRYLFNSYYEQVGPRHPRPERGLVTRLGAAEIERYRAHVDLAMGELVQAGGDQRQAELVRLGLHHEQQHQELLVMDAKHLLSKHPFGPALVIRPADDPAADVAPEPLGWR